jgi:membrane protein YqaA with SNARE-associated domain
MWRKIFLACFLQACGTAIGEIPPYWVTRSARLAGIEAGVKSENISDELEDEYSEYDIINRIKNWMIDFLNNYGFQGILLMASFPNLLFDVCGVCCGHYLMPFWTFFGATFIGKAVIRNTYQSLIYVLLLR